MDTTDDSREKDFSTEIHVNEEEEENDVTTFQLAEKIMETFRPSIVIIASPYLQTSNNGFTVPEDVGIILNHSLGMTRSVAAVILREIADGLDEDINKVMDFVKEATDE